MSLNLQQAQHCAKVFEDYFGNFNRIDEYMREQKLNSLAELPFALPGCGPEADLFSDFTMNPQYPQHSSLNLHMVCHASLVKSLIQLHHQSVDKVSCHHIAT